MTRKPLAASIAAADLGKAVAFAAAPVDKRSSIAVLTTVLLRFEAGRLTVTGTNLDVFCEMSVDAETDAPLSFCVTPDRLAGIVRAASGARVEIRQDDDACEITAGDVRAKFRSILPAGDFPATFDLRGESAAAVTVGEAVLHRMLSDTIPCISSEETRYYLNGVYMHSNGDGRLRAVATDGHRLALRRSDVEWPPKMNGIMPRAVARILHRALRADGNATITITGTGLKQVAAPDNGDWKVSYKLIDGTFPDYMQVVPKAEPAYAIPISLGMIQRVLTFARDNTGLWSGMSEGKMLRFDLDASELMTRLHDGSEIRLPITGGAGSGHIGFNGAYLRDFLRRASPAVVRGAGPVDPAMVETEDTMLTQVLMPARV